MLQVALLSGQKAELRVQPKDTLREVKEAAESELDVGIKKLVRQDGRAMGEEEMALTVEELSLQPDETLHAVTKYKMEVRRCAQTLADEICSFERTDFGDILNMLAHHLELQNAEELGCVVKVLFEKALAEPAHVETCARMAAAAKACYPVFPCENDDETGFWSTIL